jgi:hypothetical protein
MGVLPSATEIRSVLECYGITDSILSDTWIIRQRDKVVVPMIENKLNLSLSSSETKVEYLSGTGTDTLFLTRKGVSTIDSIELVNGSLDFASQTFSLDSIEIIADKGMLKSRANWPEGYYSNRFPKGNNNIKVTYTIGGTISDEIQTAIENLVAVGMLTFLEGRTGGGDLSVQGFSRNYGELGKYTYIRRQLANDAYSIIRRQMSAVVGS